MNTFPWLLYLFKQRDMYLTALILLGKKKTTTRGFETGLTKDKALENKDFPHLQYSSAVEIPPYYPIYLERKRHTLENEVDTSSNLKKT